MELYVCVGDSSEKSPNVWDLSTLACTCQVLTVGGVSVVVVSVEHRSITLTLPVTAGSRVLLVLHCTRQRNAKPHWPRTANIHMM